MSLIHLLRDRETIEKQTLKTPGGLRAGRSPRAGLPTPAMRQCGACGASLLKPKLEHTLPTSIPPLPVPVLPVP